MLYKVKLATPTQEKTAIELFPDPETVFVQCSDELLQRFLPVARFDLSLVEDGSEGSAVFLYYDDVRVDFLSWKCEDGLISEFSQDIRVVNPFYDPPETDKLRKSLGSYLKFDEFVFELDPPSAFEQREETWGSAFAETLQDLAGWNALQRLRIGGNYACYMQHDVYEDGPGFIAELPGSAFDLAPMYFYLNHAGEDGFYQEMQMT